MGLVVVCGGGRAFFLSIRAAARAGLIRVCVLCAARCCVDARLNTCILAGIALGYCVVLTYCPERERSRVSNTYKNLWNPRFSGTSSTARQALLLRQVVLAYQKAPQGRHTLVISTRWSRSSHALRGGRVCECADSEQSDVKLRWRSV